MFYLYKKNGVTLIVLITIIMVSIILTSTVVISYSSFKTNARKRAFATEIYTIEKQIENYKLRNDEYPVSSEVEFNISDLDSKLVDIMNIAGEEIANERVRLYIIDLSKLDIENVSRGAKKDGILDIYAYSKKTGKLYYLAGEEIEDKIYYNFNYELYNLLKIK